MSSGDIAKGCLNLSACSARDEFFNSFIVVVNDDGSKLFVSELFIATEAVFIDSDGCRPGIIFTFSPFKFELIVVSFIESFGANLSVFLDTFEISEVVAAEQDVFLHSLTDASSFIDSID